jgi:hypothetical protein
MAICYVNKEKEKEEIEGKLEVGEGSITCWHVCIYGKGAEWDTAPPFGWTLR